ncbi:MAG: DUF86 domain-containing protein [Clostridia bacterium]|nr:DUF86 domain-containing protein [Clostridia bacterium]
MQHRDYITLKKIMDESNIAIQLLGDTDLGAFMESELLKRAIGMTVINIGELVKNLTNEFRVSHSTIPWKEISGFRDIAAHKYKTLDMKIVYNTVKYDIVDLKNNVEIIFSKEFE